MTDRAELVLYHALAPTGRIEVSASSSSGPWLEVWIDEPLPLLDALEAWQTEAVAVEPSRTWKLDYVLVGGRATVRIETPEADAWVRLSPTLAELLGFESTVLAVGGTPVESTIRPRAVIEESSFRIGRKFPLTRERGEVARYRGARVSSYQHGRMLEVDHELYLPPECWAELEDTPLTSGHGARRVTTQTTTAFSESELEGALTLYPYSTPSVTQRSPGDHVRVALKATMRDL